MKPLSLAAAAAAALTLLLGAAAPASAVPVTELRPAELPRGADVAIPHLEGKTVVDGDVRVRIRAGLVLLLGTSGPDYVVGTSDANGDGHFRTFRVTSSGKRTPLLRGVPIFDMVLSRDGTQIGLASGSTAAHTRLRVWSAVNGDRRATHRFRGSVSILDFDARRMVLGSSGPDRTFWWNTHSDATRRITDRSGYNADIRADRLAVFTKDPYRGGCSVASRLSAAHRPLWRSCRERVQVFGPGGGRLASIPILTDGLGPRDVFLRGTGGGLRAHYRTAGWFGAITWESATALLLDTNGSVKSATVRCVVADCERASRLRPVPDLRSTTAGRG
jgi:hypothetical protein